MTGVASTITVVVITVVRQRKFEIADVGTFMAAFFSGMNLPPAAFLFWYVFAQDPVVAQSSLSGYEKYISGSGLLLFIASTIAIWKLCQTAYERA